MNGHGVIERYKARIVVDGDDQVFGREYNLKFIAVLDMTSVKVLLVVDRMCRVRGRYYEVPSAYLKAYKEEDIEIYLESDRGYVCQ